MGDFGRSTFEAIADFARRQGGGRGGGCGGRGRDDSKERESNRHEMNVPNDVIGAVIGKRGAKINEIRTLSGASINIMEVGARGGQRSRDRSPDPDRERVIEISGSTHAVTMAKSLITIAMDLGDGAQGRGG